MSVEQRVRKVEHVHFTPLIFISTGGMDDATSHVYRRLANLLSNKMKFSYEEVMGWIRCKLSFDLVWLTIMYLHGAWSWIHSPVYDMPVDEQIAEAHI